MSSDDMFDGLGAGLGEVIGEAMLPRRQARQVALARSGVKKVKVACLLSVRPDELPEGGALIARPDRIYWRSTLRRWQRVDLSHGRPTGQATQRSDTEELYYYRIADVPGVDHLATNGQNHEVVEAILSRLVDGGLGRRRGKSSYSPSGGGGVGPSAGSPDNGVDQRKPAQGSVDDPNAWR